MISDDDRMLQRLAQALAPEPVEPSEKEIAALRQAVSRRFGGQPAGRPLRALPSTRRGPVAMMFAAAALAAGFAVVAAGGSRAAHPAAVAEALPADSPELVETREAMASVRNALAAHDKASVEGCADDLRRHLERLDEGDLRAVGGEAPALLVQADAFVITITIDAPGPLQVKLTVHPPPRPPPPSTCVDEEDEEASPPHAEPDEPDEDEQADASERAERDRERAERDKQRAERDKERAKRDRERAKHDVERARHDAERARRDVERARESVEREAERARRDALKEAEKARQDVIKEALKEAEKARQEGLKEAAKARDRGLKEAEKARDRGLKEAEKARQAAMKKAFQVPAGPIRIEVHDKHKQKRLPNDERSQEETP